jgi:hypothetical protein
MEKSRSLVCSFSSRLSPKAIEVISISWVRFFPWNYHSIGFVLSPCR